MRKPLWTYLACCIAVFMISMDNLIVTNALPVIRESLHTGLEGLEWTVNAYTMTFAVLLLTGAALGDRFGRRRLLISSRASPPAPPTRCARSAPYWGSPCSARSSPPQAPWAALASSPPA